MVKIYCGECDCFYEVTERTVYTGEDDYGDEYIVVGCPNCEDYEATKIVK